ncbi:hypothetical protein [Pleomorphomonas oryzae]|uniref:hypothetical protein n=1 Tax=Pleomorphomonas oryzae TaxID=261934 RepID=UPI00041819D0|nr:hypothetical protein [Pleomorphomonas oryzae]
MRVRALYRGYIGSRIREPGEKFEIDDALWADKKLRPKWVEPVKTVLAPVDVIATDEDDDDEGNSGGTALEPDGKRGRKKKADDATEPEEPQGNGVAEALGAPADWVPQAATK